MPARALGLTWAKVSPGDRDLDVSLDVPDEMRPRGPMTIPVSIGNLAAGRRSLRHGRRRRCRHSQPHQLQDAGAGRLVLRPAQARHGNPRHLRPAHRPHAGRAGHGPLRRRQRGGAAEVAAADPEAARLLFGHPEGRRRRQGVGHLRRARLQRHRPRHGDGVEQDRRRPCRQGRVRPRSGRGHGEHSALPRHRRHIAPACRDQQRCRACRRLHARDRHRRRHRLPGRGCSHAPSRSPRSSGWRSTSRSPPMRSAIST